MSSESKIQHLQLKIIPYALRLEPFTFHTSHFTNNKLA